MQTETIDLAAAITRIRLHGPDRVVINNESEATTPGKANELGMTSDVIFIRDDGWTLGAPQRFRKEAYGTWHENWIAFIERPGIHPRPMTEFVP